MCYQNVNNHTVCKILTSMDNSLEKDINVRKLSFLFLSFVRKRIIASNKTYLCIKHGQIIFKSMILSLTFSDLGIKTRRDIDGQRIKNRKFIKNLFRNFLRIILMNIHLKVAGLQKEKKSTKNKILVIITTQTNINYQYFNLI